MHHTELITILAFGFGLAFVLGLIAARLHLPPLVGYLLVFAAPDPLQARLVLQRAREVNPEIDTVIRTHSDGEREELEARGAGRGYWSERRCPSEASFAARGTYPLPASEPRRGPD